MKNQAERRAEVERTGGEVVTASRKGSVYTVRLRFADKATAKNEAAKLRNLGWGASVDGSVVRALVVVK